MRPITLALLSSICIGGAVNAHHSDAGMDENTVLSLEGKVTEFSWKQPHVYLFVEVIEDDKPVVWSIQMPGINNLVRNRGWQRDTLVPGDEVFVRINPAEDGRPYSKLQSIQRADGSPVAPPPENKARPQALATSFAGNWLADRARSGPSYPGGFDGFFHAHLVLTETGVQAQESFDPLSSENPESTCVGRPTPSAFVSTLGYLMQFDLRDVEEEIVIRSEWFNEERTVYMDGRSHPGSSESFVTGHSIGHWEDGTLVVDTRNFDDHRSPYQVGVPSGSQKHVVEKYRLIENGAAMHAEFMLEDPEYLAEPMQHERVLLYSPHLKMLGSACDLESTSQFLR